jgi:SAM-dependent methyltransferase
MTLGTAPDLLKLLSAVGACLKPGGVFIFTIPHPFFWPTYWGYAEAPWFDYTREMAIAAPFRIGAEGTEFTTTHVHRPLAAYFEQLRRAGFELEKLEELIGRGFRLPRFIAMRCRYTVRL